MNTLDELQDELNEELGLNGIMVLCSVSGKKVPLLEGHFICDVRTGDWSFISNTELELSNSLMNKWWIQTKKVNEICCMVDFLAHISEKRWFQPAKFFGFIHKFREENEIYWTM